MENKTEDRAGRKSAYGGWISRLGKGKNRCYNNNRAASETDCRKRAEWRARGAG